MHWDVVEVKPEHHYRLFVRFKDGVAGHVQLRPEDLTGVVLSRAQCLHGCERHTHVGKESHADVIRIPRMQARPPITVGSNVIRSNIPPVWQPERYFRA